MSGKPPSAPRTPQVQAIAISNPLLGSLFPNAAAVADYAREAMAWAVSAGILRGTDRGELNPDGSASRAQFAAILQRLPEAA